jgi:hypothetical protein
MCLAHCDPETRRIAVAYCLDPQSACLPGLYPLLVQMEVLGCCEALTVVRLALAVVY